MDKEKATPDDKIDEEFATVEQFTHETLERLFTEYDKDTTDYMTRNELAGLMRKKFSEKYTKDEIDEIMAKFDEDGDGEITPEELDKISLEKFIKTISQ